MFSTSQTPLKRKLFKFLSSFVYGYGTHPERLIADYTILRCQDLDRRLRVKQLVPPTGGVSSGERNRGAQESIAYSLLEEITSDSGAPQFRSFVLTGEAGVGKSTALRTISRELALGFRDRKNPVSFMPVALPLQQVTLPPDAFVSNSTAEAERLLWHLLGYWCSWVSGLVEGNRVTIDWLRNWLRHHPSVLILDGLDEFFINNAGLDSGIVGKMLGCFGRTLEDKTTTLGSHTALVAVRNSYPGHTQFATKSFHIFLIERMTSEQALKIYPEMKDVLDRLRGTTTLSVLLTPLILSWLGPKGKELSAESLESKSVVMTHALNAIIDESHLGSPMNSSSGTVSPANVRTMLSIIGWLFFRDNKGIMSLPEILEQSHALADEWIAEVRDRHKADEIIRAFQLLANEETIRILMERTVFVSTGVDHWRFAHREWQDFLTASYMANAYYYSNFVEMGHRAMTQAIFKMIGEILTTMPGEFEITDAFTEKILEAGGLAAVNLAGVVGNATFVIHPRAIQRFLSIESLDQMDKTARLVVFTGCMYRALRADPKDASAADLRRALTKVSNEYGMEHKNPLRDALTSSLGWCYHRALCASDSRISPPKSPWPGLRFEPEHEEPVLSMLTAGRQHEFRIEPRHRSLQVAWLQILPIVLENPYRPVSVAHYLYAVVVVYRYGAHIPEVSDELPHILADDSRYAEIFRKYTAVPELWTIFSSCQKAYQTVSTSLLT